MKHCTCHFYQSVEMQFCVKTNFALADLKPSRVNESQNLWAFMLSKLEMNFSKSTTFGRRAQLTSKACNWYQPTTKESTINVLINYRIIWLWNKESSVRGWIFIRLAISIAKVQTWKAQQWQQQDDIAGRPNDRWRKLATRSDYYGGRLVGESAESLKRPD